MIEGERVLAIVPARGGSKGLPRKNLRALADKPLVAWPVAAARASRLVDRVIVSSDDEEIIAAALAAGADAPFRRPAALAADTASSADVVRHAIDELRRCEEQYRYVLLLEPTSPLTEAEDIDGALVQLHASRSLADAIVGVCRAEAAHPEFALRRGLNGVIRPYTLANFSELKRRQDVDDVYCLEGSLYASDTEVFCRIGSFYHDRTLGFAMPRWKSFEVDSLLDFYCIETILNHRDELRIVDQPFDTAASST